MKRETEQHEWVIYEMTHAELAEKLGIPERIISVSVAGQIVTIHAKAD